VLPARAPRATAAPERATLSELDTDELREAVASGRSTAVVVLGSIEQHGPHLPLATDAWIGDWLAERVCARLPSALRLPVVPFGCADEHMDFAGTLSLAPATFVALLGDLLASLAAHGFDDCLVFSAHGGNVAVLRDARDALARRAAPMSLALLCDHARLWRRLADRSREPGSSPGQAGHHAGELESSIVEALRPGALRRARLARGHVVSGDEDEEGGDPTVQHLFSPTLRANVPGGVVGDPRAADAARGVANLEAWVDELLRFYEAASTGREGRASANQRQATKGTQRP